MSVFITMEPRVGYSPSAFKKQVSLKEGTSYKVYYHLFQIEECQLVLIYGLSFFSSSSKVNIQELIGKEGFFFCKGMEGRIEQMKVTNS